MIQCDQSDDVAIKIVQGSKNLAIEFDGNEAIEGIVNQFLIAGAYGIAIAVIVKMRWDLQQGVHIVRFFVFLQTAIVCIGFVCVGYRTAFGLKLRKIVVGKLRIGLIEPRRKNIA